MTPSEHATKSSNQELASAITRTEDMAARHLQKLRGDELPLSGARDVDASDSEDESAAAQNPFDLLDQNEKDASEPDDTIAPDGAPAIQPQAGPKTTSARKKRKAKQKQKKASNSVSASAGSTATAKQTSKATPQADEDIDQLLASLNITQTAPSEASISGRRTSKTKPDEPVLLGVNPSKLKADDEMRKIFGSKVVDAEAKSKQQALPGGFADASRSVRRMLARGLLKRVQLKPGMLTTPKDHWPPFEGGIHMEVAGKPTADGRPMFRYTHSAAYHGVQMVFEQSQASFDPNSILALLEQHPYHVDSLLAMHELYRSMGEVASSDEMLERCIYALEMAWHPYFNPAAANTRMDYGLPLNRPLFVALFKQTQNLSRRGLHGTALEYAKLLLGMDPADPRGVLFCIDYLAIRAGQFNFLKRLTAQDESISQLPNFVYSTLLADFRERTGHTASKQGRGSGFAPAAAPATSSTSEAEASGEASLESRLSQAVMMYPVVVVRLMDKLKDKGVGKDAEWGSLLEKAPLRHADDLDSASLSHAVDIFVERHHLLWKAHDAQRLLKDACTLAVQASPEEQANWACVSREMFPPSQDNHYRHLRVADFSDTVSALPPEELQALQANIPPQLIEAVQRGIDAQQLADVLQISADQAAALIQAVRDGGLGAPPPANEPENLEAANPWAMLLRTLMPWINAGQAPDYDQQDDGESEDGTVESDNDLAGADGAAEGLAGEAAGPHAPADEEDDLD
ncbi:hypothetical protein ABBQ32_009867 [Trebouxia sp. C0010 RCD-2024]